MNKNQRKNLNALPDNGLYSNFKICLNQKQLSAAKNVDPFQR